MTQTTARLKRTGKNFEIIVGMEDALKFKRGESSGVNFLEIDRIFTDSKKGLVPSQSELKSAFGTEDVEAIASKIVREGEILVTQEHRSAEQEKKIKQVIDFLAKNTFDPKTGNPHTPDRIKNAIEQSGVNIKNLPIENQIHDIISEISKVIPIKMNMKKIKITVPAMHTGKAYGIISSYKEREDWLGNGDLQVLANVPAGLVMEFFDKLNSITHGSALTEEVKN